jgi:nucleotide-binding universal stress UspA family protein
MIRRILVAYDGSIFSQKALKLASAISKKMGSEISVIYVIPISPPYSESKYDQPKPDPNYLEFLKNHASKVIEDAKNIAGEEGIKINVMILKGSPVEEICKQANEENVDLIVLGSRGTNLKSKVFGLGSVAERVSRVVKNSILIVKE